MPRSKAGNAKSNSTNPNDWQKFEFAKVNLDDKAKAEFRKKFQADAGSYIQGLAEYAQGGYKFSFSWDMNGKCFIASMTCKEPSDPNYNYVLTSRSPDLYEALALNVFKTREYCADEVWTDGTEEGDWG